MRVIIAERVDGTCQDALAQTARNRETAPFQLPAHVYVEGGVQY